MMVVYVWEYTQNSDFAKEVIDSFVGYVGNSFYDPESDWLDFYIRSWVEDEPRDGVMVCGGSYTTFLEAALIIHHEYLANPAILGLSEDDEQRKVKGLFDPSTHKGEAGFDRRWFYRQVRRWEKDLPNEA